MESEIRTVSLNTGISVPCFVQGNLEQTADDGGAPLLLLHAWGESWRSFDRLIDSLPTFVIVAPDLRGHGGADKPANGYSLHEIAEDVFALMNAIGVKQAHVLGSSSGGYVAQQLAVDRPNLVASLTLVGAPLSLHGKPPFADEVELLTEPISERWMRESLSWYRLLHPVPTSYIDDRVRDGLAMPASIWKASLRGFYEAVPPTEAGDISVPTLMLCGAFDHLVPRQHQETLACRINGARLKIYEDTGHLVLWECPERVAEDVTTFLGELSKRP
ncbi:alpha/beta fold hydrolase [Paenarthrobacter aurescens]|uniref:Alpha/beta hydrolase n=1 Tax=Paenarthrobacter aurescens TaxID=43663 RepID=A0A4Y3N7M9_PAEAU|nr:alpha/beta hydrolase [Paenarthrobacter aurescens]MDO6144559.1 alpha/beta hydrolase [Paenarthrobacter aurescens]MDO6148404.1 alpha/beta hydrolase [Paenarthrobacter aurescens]MDO6159650.1 alpha/beta hydrolase [Paenarthrobacter aurescens]MDO6164552.1 alpha/beta hydrolase [Paenarthrobacter aurescens]GEB17780.1 alpha/beta hydrolase [Paenarthrobacter aurescens]